MIDAKSPFTAGHSGRVAGYCTAIADQLGLPSDRRRWLHRSGLLHDVGKLGVSNTILDKPGKLTAAEWAAMQQHTVYTEQVLARLSPFAPYARLAAAHHERLDGKGYPRGLCGAEIGLETRIITVADVFDAITADRPYRAAMPLPQAIEVMQQMRGVSLDPDCLDALLVLLGRGAAPDRLAGDASLLPGSALAAR